MNVMKMTLSLRVLTMILSIVNHYRRRLLFFFFFYLCRDCDPIRSFQYTYIWQSREDNHTSLKEEYPLDDTKRGIIE